MITADLKKEKCWIGMSWKLLKIMADLRMWMVTEPGIGSSRVHIHSKVLIWREELHMMPQADKRRTASSMDGKSPAGAESLKQRKRWCRNLIFSRRSIAVNMELYFLERRPMLHWKRWKFLRKKGNLSARCGYALSLFMMWSGSLSILMKRFS